MLYLVIKDDSTEGCVVEASDRVEAYSAAQRIGLTCIGYAEPYTRKSARPIGKIVVMRRGLV